MKEQPLAATVTLSDRDRRRLLRRIPDQPSWEWVRQRVVPVIELAKPTSSPNEPKATVTGPFGLRVGFGIDVDPILVRIPTSLVRRWKILDFTLEQAALDNLRAQARRLGSGDIEQFEERGTIVRMLGSPPANATSLVLIPDELQRILGPAPQILVTVSRALLVSLPVTTSFEMVWDFMSAIIALDPTPIHEGPFTLQDGRIELWEPPLRDVRQRAGHIS
jgi:hypothetical protein